MTRNNDKPGATGKFPYGKLDETDEGELNVAFARDDAGNLRINFGKPVAWIAMPHQVAVGFAMMILKHCGVRALVLDEPFGQEKTPPERG